MVVRHPNTQSLYPVQAQLTQHQAEAVLRGLGHVVPSNKTAALFLEELNDPSNLVICEDDSYHKILHGRMRVLEDRRRGGKVCEMCRDRRPFEAFAFDRGSFDGLQGRCRSCCARVRLELV